MRLQAVIFDRDGVILDSESSHIAATTQSFQRLGIDISEKEKEIVIGQSVDNYKDYFLNKYSFSFDEFRKFQKEIYYKLLENPRFFAETISLINQLYVRKIPLALTTSAGLEGTILFLNKANIKDKFDVIVTKEDCKNRKPHPEPYLLTAKKLDVNSQNCVVIEDTSFGVASAKEAGMKCIAIPNEFTKNQDFSKADAIVKSAKEITLNFLETL